MEEANNTLDQALRLFALISNDLAGRPDMKLGVFADCVKAIKDAKSTA